MGIPTQGFNGLRVLSFESRRAQEIAQLIRNYGGVPIVAPSMREIPAPGEEEREAIKEILKGKFDVIIFMTGVGARALLQAAEAICPREQLLSALRRTQIVVRGPKPAAVMREFQLPITLAVPEPNTWREIVQILDENSEQVPIKQRRILVQEHGEPSPELYVALRERGAEVLPIRVYRWDLPEDISPLRQAIRELVDKKIEIVMFTSSMQFIHALRVAREIGLEQGFLEGLKNVTVASIGPVASATLRENGVRVDLEPSHPKMGFLVREAAQRSAPNSTNLLRQQ